AEDVVTPCSEPEVEGSIARPLREADGGPQHARPARELGTLRAAHLRVAPRKPQAQIAGSARGAGFERDRVLLGVAGRPHVDVAIGQEALPRVPAARGFEPGVHAPATEAPGDASPLARQRLLLPALEVRRLPALPVAGFERVLAERLPDRGNPGVAAGEPEGPSRSAFAGECPDAQQSERVPALHLEASLVHSEIAVEKMKHRARSVRIGRDRAR